MIRRLFIFWFPSWIEFGIVCSVGQAAFFTSFALSPSTFIQGNSKTTCRVRGLCSPFRVVELIYLKSCSYCSQFVLQKVNQDIAPPRYTRNLVQPHIFGYVPSPLHPGKLLGDVSRRIMTASSIPQPKALQIRRIVSNVTDLLRFNCVKVLLERLATVRSSLFFIFLSMSVFHSGSYEITRISHSFYYISICTDLQSFLMDHCRY